MLLFNVVLILCLFFCWILLMSVCFKMNEQITRVSMFGACTCILIIIGYFAYFSLRSYLVFQNF
nr:MAG TPA: hypothetical protein [Caudoviricetes sp.]